MFQLESNEKIGSYIGELIQQKGWTDREFCRQYVKIVGNQESFEDDVNRLANRVSQIKKGTKSIQIYDLPIVTILLGVTCEQLLSAGNVEVKDRLHLTNYQIASTKDPKVWEMFFNDEYSPVGNLDEYNKSIIDYALEFHNYELIQYVINKGYITFTENYDCPTDVSYFAHTTLVKENMFYRNDIRNQILNSHNLYNRIVCEAIKHADVEILRNMHANACETLNQLSPIGLCPYTFHDCIESEVLEQLLQADSKVLDYYLEDIKIVNKYTKKTYRSKVMSPYVYDLVNLMVKKNHPYTKEALRIVYQHQQWVYTKFKKMVQELNRKHIEEFDKLYDSSIYSEQFIEQKHKEIEHEEIYDLRYYKGTHCIQSYDFVYRIGMVSNIIHIDTTSQEEAIQTLIEKINERYEFFMNHKQIKFFDEKR